MSARIQLRVFVAAAVGLTGCVAETGGESDGVELAEVEQLVLGPPTNVTLTGAGTDRITVSWDAVAGATKYYVYQATNVNGPYAFANTARAPSTSIQIAHLNPATNYCFSVRTEDGTGPGAFSTPVCSSTQAGPQPPDVINARPVSTTSVRVDWSPRANATKYYVYRSAAVNGSYSYLTTVFAPTLTYTNNNLPAGGTYCYKVAVDIAGQVSPLSAAHCNTSFQPPATVTATRTSPTRIQVSWSAVTGASKYYVYESRGGAPFAYATSVVQAASPTVARANLTTGVQYCYRIQSVTASNQLSPQSLPAVCATP